MSTVRKIAVLGLTVSILAFFGFRHYNQLPSTKIRVAITQIAPHLSLDQIRQGIIDELTYHYDHDIEFIYQNAQGNMTTASQIAKSFVSQKPDLIIPITTPSAQTVKLAAKDTNIPVVFAGVTNPEDAKLFDDAPCIQGVSDQLDPAYQVDLLKNIYGDKFKTLRVGTIYNAGEANAVHQVSEFEKALKKIDITLQKVSLQNTSEIAQSVRSLVGRVDVIYIMNDNAVVSGMEHLLSVAHEHHIAVVASDPHSPEHGAIASIAYDQYDMGRLAGVMALKKLQGKQMDKIEKLKNPKVYLNNDTAKALGVTFTDSLRAQTKR